jgi:hypothetical protein
MFGKNILNDDIYDIIQDDVINEINNDTDIVRLNAIQTLTNKTLTAPIISTISNTGTLTLPTTTTTLIGTNTINTLTNKTLTSPIINEIILSGTGTHTGRITGNFTTSNKTISIPNITDTLVTLTSTDILTNKTLTAPVITSIINGIGNTMSIPQPAGDDTIVSRKSVDTLTDKTFINGTTLFRNGAGDNKFLQFSTATSSNNTTTTLRANSTTDKTIDLPDISDILVSRTNTETLSNKTLHNDKGLVGAPSYSFITDTDTGIYSPFANNVSISCGNKETARLTNTINYFGNGVSIFSETTASITGTNSGVCKVYIEAPTGSSNVPLITYRKTNTAANKLCEFFSDVTTGESSKFYVEADGDVLIPTGRTYGTISDIRVKKDVKPVIGRDICDKIKQLKLISFKDKKDKSENEYLGVSAQDIEKVFPDLVKEHDDIEVDDEGNEFKIKSVGQSAFIYINLIAIQDLIKRIEVLESLL